MKITLLVDNKESWIVSYVLKLKVQLEKLGHTVVYVNAHDKIPKGDYAFFLSCEKIITGEILKRNSRNLVIHESALPEGKGWSPLTWQIIQGKNEIPITLFEANEKADSGDIYIRDYMRFRGDELLDELHAVQGKKTIDLVLKFVKTYPPVNARKQVGKESFYKKRTSKDSLLNINKSIREQFNILRIVDNDKYPAFFNHMGKKYLIKVFKSK